MKTPSYCSLAWLPSDGYTFIAKKSYKFLGFFAIIVDKIMRRIKIERVRAMKNTLIFLFVVFTIVRASYADSWARPVERLYLSENKQFVANVIPAKDNNSAMLKVFQIASNIGWIHWQCDLGNEGAPQKVFVSDDGKYVVTVNENSRRVHGGMGEFVLAFYHKKGLIKNYSLEQIMHYPDKIDKREFNKLINQFVSS